MQDAAHPAEEKSAQPRWQPVSAIDRRVAGVLVEKAKTTPNAYPLTLNAIVTASNQKSNRDPVMALEPDDVEESLDRLRKLGAVGLIEGYGRASKYRHYLYDWLGVDKVELAVMGELLLRGAQTMGELRGRAARMEPIRDLSELKPVVDSLKAKELVVALTPEGRGHVVTHALYPPEELERIKARYGGGAQAAEPASRERGPAPTAASAVPPSPAAPSPAVQSVETDVVERIVRELRDLGKQVSQLRSDLDEVMAAQDRTEEELRRLRDELGG